MRRQVQARQRPQQCNRVGSMTRLCEYLAIGKGRGPGHTQIFTPLRDPARRNLSTSAVLGSNPAALMPPKAQERGCMAAGVKNEAFRRDAVQNFGLHHHEDVGLGVGSGAGEGVQSAAEALALFVAAYGHSQDHVGHALPQIRNRKVPACTYRANRALLLRQYTFPRIAINALSIIHTQRMMHCNINKGTRATRSSRSNA